MNNARHENANIVQNLINFLIIVLLTIIIEHKLRVIEKLIEPPKFIVFL